MSKSILVIDTPKECNECPLHHSEEDICQATWEYNGWMADIKEICPLKPIPQKKGVVLIPEKENPFEFYERIGYAKGWDDCIDEILGDIALTQYVDEQGNYYLEYSVSGEVVKTIPIKKKISKERMQEMIDFLEEEIERNIPTNILYGDKMKRK